jgi:uncharacterized protein YbaR (Trm112 family)
MKRKTLELLACPTCIGGINFFNDKTGAIDEMSNRPGTKIAIADENEKAAQSIDWLPGFGRLFEQKWEVVGDQS